MVGDTGEVDWVTAGDIGLSYEKFRKAASPVPYGVLLRHYSVVDPRVLPTIAMDNEVFSRLCHAFSDARLVLFLIGVAPGTSKIRFQRRSEITRIFTDVSARRMKFEQDANASLSTEQDANVLEQTLEDLAKMKELLWSRVERQDLVTGVRSWTYEHFKR